MFRREAEWISEALAGYPATALSPLLNIGSSTLAFRLEKQPWIETVLFDPLRARGVEVVNVDVRAGHGIDLRADVTAPEGRERLRAVGARALLCNNTLEHVEDPSAFARACAEVVAPGGLLVVTVPNSYPRHRDPIDTMFRPTPAEIAALLPDHEVVAEALIPTGSYWDQLRRRPWIISRQLLRLPFPFVDFAGWKRSMMKFYWMVRPYRQSCVVLRRPTAPPAPT